jgi:hypothetical protein
MIKKYISGEQTGANQVDLNSTKISKIHAAHIIKRLDKIALAMAVLSILFGFLLGWKAYFQLAKKEITEKELAWAQRDKMYRPIRMAILEDLKYPPKWKCVIAGFLGSGVTFPVVLFGLRGLNRVLIWRVFVWVVEGPLSEKKEEEPESD